MPMSQASLQARVEELERELADAKTSRAQLKADAANAAAEQTSELLQVAKHHALALREQSEAAEAARVEVDEWKRKSAAQEADVNMAKMKVKQVHTRRRTGTPSVV